MGKAFSGLAVVGTCKGPSRLLVVGRVRGSFLSKDRSSLAEVVYNLSDLAIVSKV